jgi:predicted flavoprotein YhiN
MSKKKLIIIGGGAAGFFCAINAAIFNKDLDINILERTDKLLSKVKISGGGRCNVTHHCFDIVELSKKYPRGAAFLKKCFHQFSTQDTIDWFAQRGVLLHAEADGRMFPTTNDSQTIINCLLKEAENKGIQVKKNTTVKSFSKKDGKFNITINNGSVIEADFLCIATGGYPKLEMFDWIKELNELNELNESNESGESNELNESGESNGVNLIGEDISKSSIENTLLTSLTNMTSMTSMTSLTKIVAPLPSLFTFNMPKHPITELMGISVEDVLVKIRGTKWSQQGPVLITHWGLSGPAILKLSAFAAIDLHQMNYDFIISINWVPAYNETSLLQDWKSITTNTNQYIANHNPFKLPVRLWDYFLSCCKLEGDSKWPTVSKEKQNLLIKHLTNFECAIKGKTTFKEEFVTCGGVDIAQIDHHTLQHKNIPNLFFAGEVLNIDGITGGFNFQNAWTTGFIVGKSVGEEQLES